VYIIGQGIKDQQVFGKDMEVFQKAGRPIPPGSSVGYSHRSPLFHRSSITWPSALVLPQ
jgi:hypothetical protein